MPLSLDIKFRSKEVIDVFAYRFGKGLTALTLTSAQNLGFILHSISGGFLGVFIACIWLFGTRKIKLAQHYTKRSTADNS